MMQKKKLLPVAVAGGLLLTVNGQAFADSGSDIVNIAYKYIGKPYAWGAVVGDTSRFDCSSYTATVFKQYGIDLPRTSLQQSRVGVAVNRNQLQLGDLVFFDTDGDGVINHVGIYIGNNQMLNATESGVTVSNITSSYWAPRYVTARRVLNQSDTGQSKGQSASVYTVKPGDSLWSIGVKFGVSVSTLKSLNHLSSDIIYPGQKLKVSNGQASPSGQSDKDGDAGSASEYVVKSGDTLWDIAQTHHLTVAQLKSLNGLTSDRIYPGQKLKLTSAPVSSGSSATKTASNKNPRASVSSNATYYTVQKGDTLWDIAVKFGLSVAKLQEINQLKSPIIFPNQKLKVSAESPKPAAVKEARPVYTVKSGDTLWEIALLNDTTVGQLMKTNNLSSPIIYPGQKLVIPN
jgi:LysM repeat protein